MAKELYIIRHAKSSWLEAEFLEDINRPLSPKGVKDACKMGQFLYEEDVDFNKVMASNGIRALHTATTICAELGVDLSKITIDPRLYHASKSKIMEVARSCEDEIDCLAIFAHNPGISDLAFETESQITNVPTCTVLHYTLACDSWKELSFANMKFIRKSIPKEL